MKNPETFELRAPRGTFETFSSGENAAVIRISGSPLLHFGRSRITSFSETAVLPEKHRLHPAQNRLSAEIESIGVLPFGCEYHLRRVWTVADGFALLNCDITADNGGKIESLELEPVILPFRPVQLRYLVFGESEMRESSGKPGVIYAGEEPVIFLHAVNSAGEEVDFYAGDDFWRHRAGIRTPQAKEYQELKQDDTGIVLTRQLLLPADENSVLEKRPWRFKSLFAWRNRTEAAPLTGREISWAGCFASAASRKQIREAVRKSGENLLLSVDFPVVCRESAHIDRPGKEACEHGSFGELVSTYLWANRELHKRNAAFAILLNNHCFGHSATAANLAESPALLED